jgi:glutaredoxin
MVAKLLETKGVEYQLVDVSEDPKLRQEVIEKSSAMSVPITVKGDWEDFVIGWNPSRLMSLI